MGTDEEYDRDSARTTLALLPITEGDDRRVNRLIGIVLRERTAGGRETCQTS